MQPTDLKKIIRGEVIQDPTALEQYDHDASIFKITPECVVCPQDVEDVQKLVSFISEQKKAGENISLTARSGGTDMSGGPLSESVVVDFTKHFNRILSLNTARVVVEPGVFYRNLEEKMDDLGVMVPSYPASHSICTIGGMIANNSGGEKTLAYGKTERYVQHIRMVCSDGKEHIFEPLSEAQLSAKKKEEGFEGELYTTLDNILAKHAKKIAAAKPTVSKNSAGYFLWNVRHDGFFDLTRLIVGSQGTLGLLTQATVGVVAKKPYSQLVVVFLNDMAKLSNLVQTVLRYKPESFESFDDHTFALAIKFFPDFLKLMKAKNMISLMLQFIPEFFMVLTGGMPKLALLIELTSDEEGELRQRVSALVSALRVYGVKVRVAATARQAQKYWTIRRESFNLLRHRIRDKQTAPFIDDFIIQPEVLSEFLPKLNALLKPYEKNFVYTIAGHVGNGNFHIIPLVNIHDEKVRAQIPEIMEKVYSLVLEYHGSTTAEHNDGLIRSNYLKRMYGEDIYQLFEQVKAAFDPLGIFNPGKKVGSSLSWALKHIK